MYIYSTIRTFAEGKCTTGQCLALLLWIQSAWKFSEPRSVNWLVILKVSAFHLQHRLSQLQARAKKIFVVYLDNKIKKTQSSIGSKKVNDLYFLAVHYSRFFLNFASNKYHISITQKYVFWSSRDLNSKDLKLKLEKNKIYLCKIEKLFTNNVKLHKSSINLTVLAKEQY
jgi:hypothetical protein